LRDINYAARLWQVFKATISGALNELKELLGDAVTLVIETIEKHSLKLWLSELRTSENPAATLLCLALMSIQKRIATRWIEAI
jgi:hypothetical protein